MIIYLDLCCIQRPLDDSSQIRIGLEAQAVISILSFCESGQAELVVSDALEFETENNPDRVRRSFAMRVLSKAGHRVELSPTIIDEARRLTQSGLKPLYALHVAFAVGSGADYFGTCDDRLLKRLQKLNPDSPRPINPIELAGELLS